MESILSKVDFETQSVFNINIKIYENTVYDNTKEGEVDEHGQALDIISDLRRSIKCSSPLDNKKIIKSIVPHEDKEDENGDVCRDIEMEYYLLINNEDIDEFSEEGLKDELEEEWFTGSSSCNVEINLYTA